MFEWLSGLPKWYQMFFTSIISFVIIGTIYALIKKGASVAFGRFSLKTESKEEVADGKNIHSKCPHVKDVIILLNDTTRILSEKMEIKHYETMRRQMNFAHEKAGLIEGLMLKVFIKLLQKCDIDHPTESEAFQAYKIILTVLKHEMLAKFREYLRENNFAEMSEADFNSYTETKTDSITAKATTVLNELYYCNKPVDRESLYEANVEKTIEIRNCLREVFVHARKVAVEHKYRLEALDRKLEALIEPFLS
jgi:hypothetical protein